MEKDSFSYLLNCASTGNCIDKTSLKKLYDRSIELIDYSIELVLEFKKQGLDRAVELMHREIPIVFLRLYSKYLENPQKYLENHKEIYNTLFIKNILGTFGFYEFSRGTLEFLQDFYKVYHVLITNSAISDTEASIFRERLLKYSNYSMDIANNFIFSYYSAVNKFIKDRRIENGTFCSFNKATLDVVNNNFGRYMKKLWGDLLGLNNTFFRCYHYL